MADATAEQSNSKMMLIIMAAVAVVLAIGGAAGGYFYGVSKGAVAAAAAAATTATTQGESPKAEAKADEKATIGPLVPFDDIIVNLLDNQDTRYLKASLTLEMDGQAGADEVNARKAQVRDAILLLMSSKTINELRDLQGKLQLRADLMERINGFLQKGKVKNIYFTDFVVQ